jgi:pimeloyl-ACP methyl ester carboxylesterase
MTVRRSTSATGSPLRAARLSTGCSRVSRSPKKALDTAASSGRSTPADSSVAAIGAVAGSVSSSATRPVSARRSPRSAGVASEAIPDVVAALRGSRPLDDVAACPGPVRFVNGRFDHLRADERRFRAAASRGSVVIPRGGHYLPMTRPRVFASELQAFASAA